MYDTYTRHYTRSLVPTPRKTMRKPTKPAADFPLFAHANGQWAVKSEGRLHYFGRWDDPEGALLAYRARMVNKKIPRRKRPPKPSKPRPDWPLFAHASGQWAKKVHGKFYYFGPWADPQAALALWVKEKDDLLAGHQPQRVEGLTMRDLVNSFLTAKQSQVDCDELQESSWVDYDLACKRVLKVFGSSRLVVSLKPLDFAKLRESFAETHGPATLCGDIACVRALFNYAYESDLIEKPIKYGQSFSRPKRVELRKARQKKGPRLFAAAEIRQLLAEASPQLRAMILLAINCGFGNTDCARLELRHLDL